MPLTNDTINKIDKWLKKYPKSHKRSAVMEALRITQIENNNTLNVAIVKDVADYLAMSYIEVLEVATFYENYNIDLPPHKYQIRFCHNVSCMLNKADELLSYLEKKLDIKEGEVTADGKFLLTKVECLGACVEATTMQIGDKYYGYLDEHKLDKIIDSL